MRECGAGLNRRGGSRAITLDVGSDSAAHWQPLRLLRSMGGLEGYLGPVTPSKPSSPGAPLAPGRPGGGGGGRQEGHMITSQQWGAGEWEAWPGTCKHEGGSCRVTGRAAGKQRNEACKCPSRPVTVPLAGSRTRSESACLLQSCPRKGRRWGPRELQRSTRRPHLTPSVGPVRAGECGVG